MSIRIFDISKDAVIGFIKDDAPEHAAALSYYTVMALAPLLLLTVSIAGLFADRQHVRDELLNQFGSLTGSQGRELAQSVLDRASQPASGVTATVIGITVILISATGAFSQLKAALNSVWEVRAKAVKRAWYQSAWSMVRERLLSFAMLIVIAFLLLVSLVVSTALTAVAAWSERVLPAHEVLLQLANIGVSVLVSAVLFALIFKVLPDAHIGWREVWLGAFVTSVLFNLGKFLIGLYLGRSSVASPFGAAGSVIVLLLWIYYSSMILLMGAEITSATAKRLGKALRPSEGFEIGPEAG